MSPSTILVHAVVAVTLLLCVTGTGGVGVVRALKLGEDNGAVHTGCQNALPQPESMFASRAFGFEPVCIDATAVGRSSTVEKAVSRVIEPEAETMSTARRWSRTIMAAPGESWLWVPRLLRKVHMPLLNEAPAHPKVCEHMLLQAATFGKPESELKVLLAE